MSKNFLWVEKYRPTRLDDVILPKGLLDTFKSMVKAGEVQNMLFTGSAGLGKTTVAKALCNELDLDYIMINGSEDGNIDTLRGKIKQFATTVSLTGNKKVVILDEADYLNPQSTQPALRGFIEQYSDNCRFILTCNFKNRIIEPLHSRCGVYEFNTTKKDMVGLAEKFFKRAKYILTNEGIEFNEKDLPPIIIKHAPDWRRIINELQRNSVLGFAGRTVSDSTGFDSLFQFLKEKDFKKMRRWVVDNMDLEPTAIFRGIYNKMETVVKPSSMPQLVLILADYQHKNAFVADHELNIVACLTEIMANVEFI